MPSGPPAGILDEILKRAIGLLVATEKRIVGRPRYEQGWLEIVGQRQKKWCAHWHVYLPGPDGREVRRHRNKVLGRIDQMSESKARQLLREFILAAEQNAQVWQNDPQITFGQYWRARYWPLKVGTWAPSTREVNQRIFDLFLEPRWGTLRLREIADVAIAQWLAEIAEKKSRSLVHKCYTYMNASLEHAVATGVLYRNPMQFVSMPKTRRPSRDVLSAEDVRRLWGAIPRFRDQLMFEIFVLCGLRANELFALRWDDVLPNALKIDESLHNLKARETKTEGSNALVALPKPTAERLKQWKLTSEHTGARDWIFPAKAGKPIRDSSWQDYVLTPAATTTGLKVNYQILRRTFGTLAHDSGIPMKLVQAQMRHNSIQTTADVYVQPIQESLHRAIDSLAKTIFPVREKTDNSEMPVQNGSEKSEKG